METPTTLLRARRPGHLRRSSNLDLERPIFNLLQRPKIKFFHPGFEKSKLLTLPRVDPSHTSMTRTYGVHHRTALLACQIIAANSFENSYFSLDREGQQRVEVPEDGVLTDEKYYFIVEGSPQYPIVPSFRDWQFPDIIPDGWPSVIGSGDTRECVASKSIYHIRETYLVPENEIPWFEHNQMKQFGSGAAGVYNRTNIVSMRKGLRRLFDQGDFVIVPKLVSVDGEGSIQYVLHILSKSGGAAEIWPALHNTLAETLFPGTATRAHILARFAWAVLRRVENDSDGRIPRTPRVADESKWRYWHQEDGSSEEDSDSYPW